ncbi:MAG: Tex-like N-terminal domain-containing protein [Thermoguttaceae bacterium]
MASMVTIDLRHVARGLDFPLRQVQAVVELLDEGNTVPFITRYRKDQTGGLDEEQIREIQDRLAKMRLLADRKQTILRSIESQGKLTEKLAKQILSATTTKRLEDLYLPYKPKKQTLATLARSRGLEELATEILEAAPTANDLDARARDFANPDRQVPSGADALLGAGHILAEQFSERADLRQRLREILQKTGKIVTTQIAPDPVVAPAPVPSEETKPQAAQTPDGTSIQPVSTSTEPLVAQTPAEDVADVTEPTVPLAVAVASAPSADTSDTQLAAVFVADVVPETHGLAEAKGLAEEHGQTEGERGPEKVEVEPVASEPIAAVPVPVEHSAGVATSASAGEVTSASVGEATGASAGETVGTAETTPVGDVPPSVEAKPPVAPAAARRARDRERAKAEKQNKKEAKRKKIEERRIKAFRDYFNYAEDIKKIPPHRVLAINRAERAKILRVKIECHFDSICAAMDEILVPPGHPHADYLRGCARDALSRLILPALEREARRELTDRAESHAVGVFARNLRNLLLQPPIHNRRVLAVDPGFKSGCKLAALDQFGNVLGHDVIFLIGSKPGRKEEAKQKAIELIRKHELTVVAIGNGTACRETEDFFAEMFGAELKDQGVAYVIVNEAGASVYSTSQLGREEFPEYDATLRGAVSIGRRLLDPLSELVKIEPANIGVGLYQHDVKAKHLEASLDEVVESCVNYVGVDVNTASPALLRYVSGLNQLTARRVYEHRREHGPFRSREQLREVPGFGDATFVQAAGFLKIAGGENPLDSTWIHPESYTIATRVLERFGGKPADLTEKEAAAALAQRMAAVDLERLAKDLTPISAEVPAANVAVNEIPEAVAPVEASAPASLAEAVSEIPVGEPVSEIPAEAATVAAAPVVEPVAPRSVSKETAVGTLTLRDILSQLARPGRDPREDLPAPVFKQGVLKLEDLTPGMELTGTVLIVVDFGCFVDIGMHDSGLVHVSRLADRFIRDPHEVVAVGDIVKVWVMEVDKERRRVSLTMVRPGSERPRRPARGEGGDFPRAQQAGQDQAAAGQGPAGQDRARGQFGDRPPRSGQGRQGGRRDGQQNQQGGQQNQQGGQQNQQGGRPQGGRPQGGRPQGGRPQQAGAPQLGGAPQGESGPGGKPREDRGGYGGPPPRKPRPQGPGQGRPLEFKSKPKPLIPITDEMKKGKEPMRTFGDLMQFFEAKTDDKKPSAPNKKGQGEKRAPAVTDAPSAEIATDPVVPEIGSAAPEVGATVPEGGSLIDVNLGTQSPAPPFSLEQRGLLPPVPGEPSPVPQTPPADEG